MVKRIALLLLCVIGLAVCVYAESVPLRISLYANVSTSDGEPLTDVVQRVDVQLYSDDEATEWSEVHTQVSFVSGIAELLIGSVTTLNAEDFDISSPNFRIMIDGSSVDPVSIYSVGYALRSEVAGSVAWDDVDGAPTFSDDALTVTTLNVTSIMLDGESIEDIMASTAQTANVALAVEWSGISDVPAGLDDGDDDTTYNVGSGFSLDGTTLNFVNELNWDSTNTEFEVSGDIHAEGFYVSGVPVGTSSDSYWNLVSTDIYYSNNVGIGLTEPSTALEVEGTVSASAFVGDASGLTGIVNASVSDNAAIAFSKLDIATTDITAMGFVTGGVQAGTIVDADVAAGAAIAFEKLDIVTADITGLGFVTGGVQAGTISDSDVAADADIAFSKLAISTSDIASFGFVTGGVQAGTITDSDVAADAAIAFSKLAIASTDITAMGFVTDAIKSGFLVDSDVAAGAAIAFSKLAIASTDITAMGFVTDAVKSGFLVDSDVAAGAAIAFSKLAIASTDITAMGFVTDAVKSGFLVDADVANGAAIAFEKLDIVTTDITAMGFVTGAISSDEIDDYLAGKGYLVSANNLSDVRSTSSARTNLGLGALAVKDTIVDADVSINAAIAFSKLSVATTDITAMGFVTDAIKSGFLVDADVAAGAAIAFEKLDIVTTDITAMGFVTGATTLTEVESLLSTKGYLVSGNNLSDVADVSTARTNLGLGTSDSPSFAGVTTTGELTVGTDVSVGDGLEVDGDVTFNQSVQFDQVDLGDVSGLLTVDWRSGNKQKITVAGNVGVDFTPPNGPASLMLIIYQEAVGGGNVLTWTDADIRWPYGVEPPLSTDAGSIDVVTFYYDGTYFLSVGSLNFQAAE